MRGIATAATILGLVAIFAGCSDDQSNTTTGTGGSATGVGEGGGTGTGDGGGGASASVRVAQYNIFVLTSSKLLPGSSQMQAAAQVVARFSPDVLAVNEFWYGDGSAPSTPGAIDTGGNAATFVERLNEAGPTAPYTDQVMIASNAGTVWNGYDAQQHDPYFQSEGLGNNPGDLSYALVARHPIVTDEIRVITDFAWTDLPDNVTGDLLTAEGITVPDGYPLFDKGLLVVPVDADGTRLNAVMCHTVPPINHPVNVYRNRDQIRAMHLFVEGNLPGVEPLPAGEPFVLLGDFNNDPEDGDAIPGSMMGLLTSSALLAFQPETGAGTVGTNANRNTFESACPAAGGPAPGLGNQFQLDYLLPAATFGEVLDGGVFFPAPETEDWTLACEGSDHMLLWADLPFGG